MFKIFKIAIRNLQRYTRRTVLTALLIVVGLVMVILFSVRCKAICKAFTFWKALFSSSDVAEISP